MSKEYQDWVARGRPPGETDPAKVRKFENALGSDGNAAGAFRRANKDRPDGVPQPVETPSVDDLPPYSEGPMT